MVSEKPVMPPRAIGLTPMLPVMTDWGTVEMPVFDRITKSPAVDLGTAGDFVILSKTGISTVPQSVITGNIGVSPIARGGMTGFSETMDGTNSFSTSGPVVGKLFAADYSGSSPSNLGIAVLDMQAAYT